MPITHKGLCYWPVPKCACTSVKTFFATNAEPALKSQSRIVVHGVPSFRILKFDQTYYESIDASIHTAVIRDPVKRLISAYVNRVWQKKDLTKRRNPMPEGFHYAPSPNAFFRNMAKAQAVSRSILHHTLPHCEFLGPTLERYQPVDEVAYA